MKPAQTDEPIVVRTRFGEIAVRPDCRCGLCRAHRGERTIEIRTLEENRLRGGGR